MFRLKFLSLTQGRKKKRSVRPSASFDGRDSACDVSYTSRQYVRRTGELVQNFSCLTPIGNTCSNQCRVRHHGLGPLRNTATLISHNNTYLETCTAVCIVSLRMRTLSVTARQ
jgi:hypothetical protein